MTSNPASTTLLPGTLPVETGWFARLQDELGSSGWAGLAAEHTAGYDAAGPDRGSADEPEVTTVPGSSDRLGEFPVLAQTPELGAMLQGCCRSTA